MCRLACLLIAALALPTETARAAEPRKMAVLPLTGKRVAKETTEILDELLLNQLYGRKGYKVIGASDINAMLGLEKMKEALGCDDVACATEIGGALGVELLLAGTVSKLGDQIIVSLRLLDTARQEVIGNGEAKCRADENLYDWAVRASVARLFGEQPPPEPQTAQPAAAVAAAPPATPAPAQPAAPTAPRRVSVHAMGQYFPTQGDAPEQMSVLAGPRLTFRVGSAGLAIVAQAGYGASGKRPGYGRHGLLLGGGAQYDYSILGDEEITVFGRVTYDYLVAAFNDKNTFPEGYDFSGAFIVSGGARFYRAVEVSLLVGQRYFRGVGYGLGAAFGF
jgi:hypothetical protein